MPLKLGEIAARHRAMLDRWSLLDAPDPATAALVTEAKAAIDSGRYDEADALLVRTEEQDVGAAPQGGTTGAQRTTGCRAALAECGKWRSSTTASLAAYG